MKRLRLPATMQSLEGFRSFLGQELEHLRVAPGRRLEIELVLEELLSNIIRYAYPRDSGEVEVGYSLEHPHRLCVFLKDWGRRFNPLEYGPPELSLDLSRRPIGGLGVYLARQLVDNLEYCYEDQANRVTLCFNLAPPPAGS